MKLYLIKTENGYLIGATASDLALAFTEKGECGTYRSLPYPPHNPTWIEMPDEEKRTYALDYLKALGENYEWRELLDRTYGDKEDSPNAYGEPTSDLLKEGEILAEYNQPIGICIGDRTHRLTNSQAVKLLGKEKIEDILGEPNVEWYKEQGLKTTEEFLTEFFNSFQQDIIVPEDEL